MDSNDSVVMRIGQYQLENLQKNNVTFLYFDLRAPENRDERSIKHFLLRGSQPVAPERVLEAVQASGVDANAPIVLICENGTKSVEAARVLEQNSYINVFIVLGGTASLDFT